MSLEHPTPSPFSSKRPSFKFLSRFNGKKSKKALIISGIALLSVVGILTLSTLPLEGKVLTVHLENFTKGFTEEAQVQALNELSLYNSIDGKIETLHVENGDPVAKGQLLVEFETQDLQNHVDVLKAQLTSLEGQRQQASQAPRPALILQQNLLIDLAEKEYLTHQQALARSKALYEAGAIPLVDYEEAQHLTEKAQNLLEQQKLGLQLLYEQGEAPSGSSLYFTGQKKALVSQISLLEDKIQKSKIKAPQDGIVKDLTLKAGMALPSGQHLLSIAPDKGYRLDSYILASDALDIQPGSEVKILQETSSEDITLNGKVESVEPSATERISPLGLKENRVKVVILLETDTPVILGSTMDVQFVTHQELNRLLVPKTVLFPYEDGQALWVIRDGKVRLQQVTKGLENQKETIIEKGLQDGDQILLDSELKGLKEGKRIKAAQ